METSNTNGGTGPNNTPAPVPPDEPTGPHPHVPRAPASTGRQSILTPQASSPEPPTRPVENRTAAVRIGGQGALLLAGFATAQLFAFLRNAMIGQWLSQGDFGIAATITLTLQLVEILSDVGSDRLIVQSKDGDDPRLTALAHLTWILKGLLTGLAVYLLAAPMTQVLDIPQARFTFELASLVPVIKGFSHLDFRWRQRQLKNGPFVVFEVAPQAVSCLLAPALLTLQPTYAVLPWLMLFGAAAGTAMSHITASRPYEIAFSRTYLRETFRFGWPIWLSALPLVAVYQGDRLLIGGLMGMEAVAAYSTAFMLTMIPGLLAAKAGTSMMLPLLSEVRDHRAAFAGRYALMGELTVILAASYLTGFALSGGAVLPVVFGNAYSGLHTLIVCLAAMWCVRMVQAVPGMALMARADTRPFLIGGTIRALGLPLAYLAAQAGYGLIGMALAGLIAETFSLVYMAIRAGHHDRGLVATFTVRCLGLLPAIAIAVVVVLSGDAATSTAPGLAPLGRLQGSGLLQPLLVSILAALAMATFLACVMPATKRLLLDTILRGTQHRKAVGSPHGPMIRSES